MLTRGAKEQQFLFNTLAKNWDVHAKLIFKYQILCLDRITLILWRHLVNDIDFCRSPKSPKNPQNPYFGAQDHPRSLSSVAIESQCTTSY